MLLEAAGQNLKIEMSALSELVKLEKLVVAQVLSSSGSRQYSCGNVSKAELEPHVNTLRLLSKKYLTGESVKLDVTQVKSYALYFLPLNFSKVRFLLRHAQIKTSAAIRILDFGCGPGSAALAACSHFGSDQVLEISLVDSSPACLDFAKHLIASFRRDTKLHTLPGLTSLEKGQFDFVIAANVLTELSEHTFSQVVTDLLQLLNVNGSLILLEPALKTCTQRLMHQRDRLLKAWPDLKVRFPCPNSAPCPMRTQDPDNWCHGTLEASDWQRSNLLQQIDEQIGFNKHSIKYSAMIFNRGAEQDSQSFRLLLKAGTQRTALVCGRGQLLRINPKTIREPQLKRALKSGPSYCSLPSDPPTESPK